MQLVSNEHRKRIKFQICSESTIILDAHPDYRGPVFESIMQMFNGEFNQTIKAWIFDRNNYQPLLEKVQEYLIDIGVAYRLVLDPIPEYVERYLRPIGNSITFKHQTETQGILNHTIEYEMIKEARRGLDNLPEKMQTALYAFQKEGIEFGIKRFGRLLIGDEMGVGKSIQALGLASVYRDEWPVLIICPSSLKLIWKREIGRWLTYQIKERGSQQVKDVPEPVQVICAASDKLNMKASFYIISVDLAKTMLHILLQREFKVIICDEAHYLKNMDTKRCKGIVPLMRLARRVFLLTGTPALAKPKELFPLLSTIRPDLFQSFREFGKRYCNPQTSRFTKQVEYDGHDNIEELSYVLHQYMIRRLKKDVLTELPSKTRQVIEIRPSNKELKEVKNLISEISAGGMKVGNVIERLSGDNAVPRTNIDVLREGPPREKEDSSKLLHLATKCFELTAQCKLESVCEFLRDLDEYDQKLVIFAHHTIMIDGLEAFFKKIGKGYIRIDGRVDPNERGRLVEKYQSCDQIKYAILGITSCSTGFTLTTSSTVIFAELHWTPANIIQAEDRCHRIGQKSNVTCYYLLAEETLDKDIFRLIKTKFETTSKFLDGEKAQILHVEGANKERELQKNLVEADPIEEQEAQELLHEMEEANMCMVDPNGNPIIAETSIQQKPVEIKPSSDMQFSEETQNQLKNAIAAGTFGDMEPKKTFGYSGEGPNTSKAPVSEGPKFTSTFTPTYNQVSSQGTDLSFQPQTKAFGYGTNPNQQQETDTKASNSEPSNQGAGGSSQVEKTSAANLHQMFRQPLAETSSVAKPINLSVPTPAQSNAAKEYYNSHKNSNDYSRSGNSSSFPTSYSVPISHTKHTENAPQRPPAPPRKEINIYPPPRSQAPPTPQPKPQPAAPAPMVNNPGMVIPGNPALAKPTGLPMGPAGFIPNQMHLNMLQRQIMNQTQQAIQASTTSRRPVRMPEQQNPLPPIEHTFDLSGYLPPFLLMTSKGNISDFFGKLPCTSDGFGNYPYGANTSSAAIGDRLRGFPTVYAGSKYRGEDKPALAAVQQKLRELNSAPDNTLHTKGISGPVGEITFVPKTEEEIREAKELKNGSGKKKRGQKGREQLDRPLILESTSAKEQAANSQIVAETNPVANIFAQARKPMVGVTGVSQPVVPVTTATGVNPLLSTFSSPGTTQQPNQPPLPNMFKPAAGPAVPNSLGFSGLVAEPPRPNFGQNLGGGFGSNSLRLPTGPTEPQFSTSTGNPVIQMPPFGMGQTGMGFPNQYIPFMMPQYMARPAMGPPTSYPMMMPFPGMDPSSNPLLAMQSASYNQMMMPYQMMNPMALQQQQMAMGGTQLPKSDRR